MAVGAIMVAGASAAVGWYGVKLLVTPDTQAAQDPAPTVTSEATTVPVTFAVEDIKSQASGLFTPPACGEEFSAEATAANGILPSVSVTHDATGASAAISFATEGDSATAFLAQQGQLIVTRDGVVVTPEGGGEFVPEYFVASPSGDATVTDTIDFEATSLCDVASEFSTIWDDFDWASASEAEVTARQELAAQFEEEHSELPAGEYKVYVWTPVILGESAAAARALIEEGFSDLAYLQYTAGYSPLSGSAELEEYCSEHETPDGASELLCDVPQDVLTTLLERDVPEYYVVDAAPAVAISEAATFTVE